MKANEPRPKSILKRPQDQEQPEIRGIRWDEDNLMITEAQKDSTMKVTEPKTPYIHYDHETDRATTSGVQPFELERAMADISTSPSKSALFDNETEMDWSDEEDKKQQEIGI